MFFLLIKIITTHIYPISVFIKSFVNFFCCLCRLYKNNLLYRYNQHHFLDEKLKKKKKKKKKKKENNSSDEDEWVESGGNKTKTEKATGGAAGGEKEEVVQRDDWMQLGLLSTYSRSDYLSKKVKTCCYSSGVDPDPYRTKLICRIWIRIKIRI